MDWKIFRDRAERTARTVVEKAAPVAKVIAAGAGVVAGMQRASGIGIVAAAASAVAETDSVLREMGHTLLARRWERGFMSDVTVEQALLAIGAKRVTRTESRVYYIDDLKFLANDHELWVNRIPGPELLARLVATLDLPDAVELPAPSDEWVEPDDPRPTVLRGMPSPEADRVLDWTLPMLDEPRAILLHGRPGVGKTRAAHWVAARVRERLGGRMVVVSNRWATVPDWSSPSRAAEMLQNSVRALGGTVAVLDELDKVDVSHEMVEALRGCVRLAVFVANNGDRADVIDGCAARPERIDETFPITDVGVFLRPDPPFDRLPPDVWERVRGWSAASVTEVGRRLERRTAGLDGDDLVAALRLDEIEEREGRSVTSAADRD